MASSKDPKSARADADRVSALAAEVISVLNNRPQPEPAALRASVVDFILESVVFNFGFDPVTLIANVRAKRISEQEIADLYVPEVARHLGCGWTNSELSFVDVTLGVMRLQSLVGELSANWDTANLNMEENRSVLLINCDGDQHTLGAVVVGTQLRRAGLSVEHIHGGTQDEILSSVRYGLPDMVLFSVSRPELLAFVRETVTKIRREQEKCPAMVLGGIILEQEKDVKEKTHVDLVTNDIQLALRLCTSESEPVAKVAE